MYLPLYTAVRVLCVVVFCVNVCDTCILTLFGSICSLSLIHNLLVFALNFVLLSNLNKTEQGG
jgi:hypothetical protein